MNLGTIKILKFKSTGRSIRSTALINKKQMKNFENLTDKQIDAIETIITSFEKSNEKQKAKINASPIDALFIAADREEQRMNAWYDRIKNDNAIIKANLQNALITLATRLNKLFKNYNITVKSDKNSIHFIAMQDDGQEVSIHNLYAIGNTHYKRTNYDNSNRGKIEVDAYTGFSIGYQSNSPWDYENIENCPNFLKCVERLFSSDSKRYIRKNN